jgi:hypothetical protein
MTLPLDPEEMRRWCSSIAPTLPRRVIGSNYLTRYYLAGWNREQQRPTGPGLYLHHFVGSDSRDVHSHPWRWAASVILVGGYREERCTSDGKLALRDFYPGDVNVIHADDRHRIDLLGPECWSLFFTGPYLQDWTFYPSCEGEPV